MTAQPPPLLLLHGALGASDQFAPLLPALAGEFQLLTLDFEGHGKAPAADRPFRIEHFVDNVLGFLDDRSIPETDIFGYSMGGFVGLRLALAHPTRVRRLATLGTIFRWNRDVAARELKHLDANAIASSVPRFARVLEERHTVSGWRTVIEKTRELLAFLADEGGIDAATARALPHAVRIIAGDRDRSVDIPHSFDLAGAMPCGQMEVLPGTPHPFDRVDPARLGRSLREFFEGHDD